MTGSTRRRLLFVDDERLVLDGLRRSLGSQRQVWDVDFADSGAAALERMADVPYDAVVTDFRMPGMDGGELLRAVRDLHPETARLVLTGHTDRDDLIGVLSVANCFLDKPCDRALLIDAIEHALAVRDAQVSRPVREDRWRSSEGDA
jgi:DNA-binding NarL/FixJ family response regulator